MRFVATNNIKSDGSDYATFCAIWEDDLLRGPDRKCIVIVNVLEKKKNNEIQFSQKNVYLFDTTFLVQPRSGTM